MGASVDVSLSKLIDDAARVSYEHYNGPGSWSGTNAQQRSNARLAVRKILATFSKGGLTLQQNESSASVRVVTAKAG